MRPHFTRILVPVDFSPSSDAALQYAYALAEKVQASIELLHVVHDPITSGAWGAEAYVMDVPHLMASLVEEATARLQYRKNLLPPGAVAVQVRATSGVPAAVIAATAASDGCDLIVMGTHGRTGVAQIVSGSVAERVMRTAPCPVLTVRADWAGSGHGGSLAESTATVTQPTACCLSPSSPSRSESARPAH